METALAAAVTLVSVVIVGQHAWAGKAHFASATMPRGAMLVSVAVIVASLAYLLLTWLHPLWLPAVVAGVVLELLGLALFWRTIAASREAKLLFAFDKAKPHGLVRHGPYRFVRHPFYTSYIVFWAGWSIATWSLWALPLLVLMIAIYVVAARDEERKFAATSLADDYRQYRQQAGMFWPRLPG